MAVCGSGINRTGNCSSCKAHTHSYHCIYKSLQSSLQQNNLLLMRIMPSHCDVFSSSQNWRKSCMLRRTTIFDFAVKYNNKIIHLILSSTLLFIAQYPLWATIGHKQMTIEYFAFFVSLAVMGVCLPIFPR